ncbi:MAG: hypothetical protein IJR99_02105 [Kiritimatiellae bacterium]|nr:hypothetical protein [Kiritimatiellia bacterium]
MKLRYLLCGLFASAVLKSAADDLSQAFSSPPNVEGVRAITSFSLPKGDESALHFAYAQLDRARELGAGGVLVALPTATPEVWKNWTAIANRAKQFQMDLSFCDFSLTNSPAPNRKTPSSRGDFARHLNLLLFESQHRLGGTYGDNVLGYHFPYIPADRSDIVNDLVQEAGLHASLGIFGAPFTPESVAFYYHRPMLQDTTRNISANPTNEVESAALQQRRRQRYLYNCRAGAAARTMWRAQIWGHLNLTRAEKPPAADLLPFPWKPLADNLLTAGANRILLFTGDKMPSDDREFREMRQGCAYLHRCQFLLQKGSRVADFLLWSGPIADEWPDGYSFDGTDLTMLDHASIQKGKIRFPSELSYQTLVIATNVLADTHCRYLADRCRQEGIRVYSFPGDESFAKRDLTWRTDADEKPVIRFIHRRTPDEEIYFVVNASPIAGVATIRFRDTGRGVPERWNPMTGETAYPESSRRLPDSSVEIPLFLDVYDSCFIVFRKKATGAD